ncbi:MAG: hypothetical protein ACRDKJ_07420 [Actinomycetota bacterium]
MAKLRAPVPHVRKSVLVFGGLVLGVALLGFVLVSVVGGGGGESAAPNASPNASPGITRPSPSGPSNGNSAAPKLRDGGTDPFRPLVVAAAAGAAPAPAATPEPAAASSPEAILLEVLSVDKGVADIRVDSNLHEDVKAGAQLSGGFVLEAISGECAYIARSPERFRVCEGERFLK